MSNLLNRVAQQLRAAQDASDKLNAFLAKRADAGHFICQIAADLETALALAETSLIAAQPSILDIYEVEAANRIAPDFTGLRSFRPRFLPQDHRVSWTSIIIGGVTVAFSVSILAGVLLRVVINAIQRHA